MAYLPVTPLFELYFDISDDRLNMVRIGTSMNRITPALTNYDVCAEHDDVIPDGVTRSFCCSAHGRYVIIQLELQGVLTLCEVKVF